MKNIFFTLCMLLSFNALAGFESLKCFGELEGKNVRSTRLFKNDKGTEYTGEKNGYHFKAIKSDTKISLEISSNNELIVSEEFREDDDLVLAALLDKGLSASIYCYESL